MEMEGKDSTSSADDSRAKEASLKCSRDKGRGFSEPFLYEVVEGAR